jgi:hypothetical protein
MNETLKAIFQQLRVSSRATDEERDAVDRLLQAAYLLPPKQSGLYYTLRESAAQALRQQMIGGVISLIRGEGVPFLPFPAHEYLLGSGKPPQESNGYVIDRILLTYLLTDTHSQEYCDEGYHAEKTVSFFNHYLKKYLAEFPNNQFAHLISNRLSHYIYRQMNQPSPLGHCAESEAEAIAYHAKRILDELERFSYVCFSGGINSCSGNGHALFYEFWKEQSGKISFRITNSGDGLRYHPHFTASNNQRRKELYFRQLQFPPALLEELIQGCFIEMLLFYAEGSTKHVDFVELSAIDNLYANIFASWPTVRVGKEEESKLQILALNPGDTQRGESCAVKSIFKWIKGMALNGPDELLSHHHLIAWLKIAALSDALDTDEKYECGFLRHAIKKISSHLIKMDGLGSLSEGIYQLWAAVSTKVEGFLSAQQKATAGLSEMAVEWGTFASAPFEYILPRGLNEVADGRDVHYFHFTAADRPASLEALRKLTQIARCDRDSERVAYVNFLRCLPDCDRFNCHYPPVEAPSSQNQGNKRRRCAPQSAESPTERPVTQRSGSYENELLPGEESVLTAASKTLFKGQLPQASDRKRRHECSIFSAAHPELQSAEERSQFIEGLGQLLCQLTVATTEPLTPYLASDFQPDLINCWLILYCEAKRLNSLSLALYHEWICALDLLIATHEREWTFATLRSFERFRAVKDFCTQEKATLEKSSNEQLLLIHPQYWSPMRNEEECIYESILHPFNFLGAKNGLKLRRCKEFAAKNFPAMAYFAYKILNSHSKAEPKMSSEREELWRDLRHNAKEIFGLEVSNIASQQKANRLFQAMWVALPHVPLYDMLRRSLVSLHLLADPHLSLQRKSDIGAPSSNSANADAGDPAKIRSLDEGHIIKDSHFDFAWTNINYHSSFSLYLFGSRGCPETHFPRLEFLDIQNQDFNAVWREFVGSIASRPPAKIPFFDTYQEAAWISGVAPLPHLATEEALIFFRSNILELANPLLQRSFTHFLFGAGQWKKWDLQMAQGNWHRGELSLLLNFIQAGYEELMRDIGLQVGQQQSDCSSAVAAYLFHLHGKVVALALLKQPKHPFTQMLTTGFFASWKSLLNTSKENSLLCKALGEAAFSLNAMMERTPILSSMDEWIHLLAATILLDCMPILPPPDWQPAMEVLYGYNSFKAALNSMTSEKQSQIWKSVVADLFGEEEAFKAHYEDDEKILHLSRLSIDLARRKIIGKGDLRLRLPPKEIIENSSYRMLFKEAIPAKYKSIGGNEIYTFQYRGASYRISLRASDEHLEISKKIEGAFCSLQLKTVDSIWKSEGQNSIVLLSKCFSPHRRYIFWSSPTGTIYVENSHTSKLVAYAADGRICKISNGKPTELVLASKLADKHPLLRLLRAQALHMDLWLNEDLTPHHFELPDLGLKFLPSDHSPEEWFCTAFPGFKLSRLSSPPFLANSEHFILENRQGQYKYIYYDNCLISSHEYAASWEYTVFDADEQNLFPVIPPIAENYPQLARLFVTTAKAGLYDEALDLISSVRDSTPDPLSDKVCKIFDEFSRSDTPAFPELIALQLHAAHWRLRTRSTPMSKEVVVKALRNYHRNINNIGRCKLPSGMLKELEHQSGIRLSPSTRAFKTVAREISGMTEVSSEEAQQMGVLLPKRKKILATLNAFKTSVERGESPVPILEFPTGDSFIENFLCHYFFIAYSPNRHNYLHARLLMKILLMQRYSECEEFLAIYPMLMEALRLWNEDYSKGIVNSNLYLKSRFKQLAGIFHITTKKSFCKQLNNFRKECLESCADIRINLPSWFTGDDPLYQLNTLPQSFLKLDSEELQEELPTESVYIRLKNLPETFTLGAIKESLWELSPKMESANSRCGTEELTRWIAASRKSPLVNFVALLMLTGIEQGIAESLEATAKASMASGPIKILTRDLPKLQQALKRYQNDLQMAWTELSAQELKLLAQANELYGNKLTHLKRVTGERQVIGIETLLFALARRDWQELLDRNPSLSHLELQLLIDGVMEYALKKTACQRYERNFRLLGRYCQAVTKEKKATIERLANEYATAVYAKRVYDPAEHPGMLVYELFTKLAIRQEQKIFLDKLLARDERYALHEATTGFGKSKVILPLWLMLNANSIHNALMIIPATLFEQQVAYLQKVLKGAFDCYGAVLHFSRESPSDAKAIDNIIEMLKNAKNRRQPVFLSDRTAHSLFVLKLKELSVATNDGVAHDALCKLLELRRYLTMECTLYIDEPHLVLDDNSEVNYSFGKKGPFNAQKTSIIFTLYSTLLELAHGKWRLSWHQAEPHLPLLTESNLHRELLLPLLTRAAERLKLALTSEEKAYLSGEMVLDRQMAFEAQLATVSSEDEKFRARTLRILHDQLHHYLPYTVCKKPGEHYAAADSDSQRLAIPIEDARHAKVGSEFISSDQTINFTFQLNMAMPFTVNFVDNFLQQLRKEAVAELQGECPQLSATKAYAEWVELTEGIPAAPKSFFNMTQSELDLFVAEINQNDILCLRFCKKAVLDPHGSSCEKVSSNSHLLTNCFSNIVGASATLSTQNIPHQFAVHRDYRSIANSLMVLTAKYQARGNPPLREFSASDSPSIVQQLPKYFPHASVVLEVGALLGGFHRLRELAAAFLAALPRERFDGVVVFDRSGVPQVLCHGHKHFLPKEGSTLAEKRLFWVYGQKDITGTDQSLPGNAHGILLVNGNTTLTQLIQGMGRLRRLGTSQNIELAVDGDSAAQVKRSLQLPVESPLMLSDFLFYCLNIEGDTNGKANFISLERQAKAVLENRFVDYLIQNRMDPYLKLGELLTAIEPLLKEHTEVDPLLRGTLHKETMAIDKALEYAKMQFDATAREIRTKLVGINHPLQYGYFEGMAASDYGKIIGKLTFPKEVQLCASSQATQVSEVAAEQETAVVRDALQDVNRNAEIYIRRNGWATRQAQRTALPYQIELVAHPVKAYFSKAAALQKFMALFDQSTLYVSFNAAVTFEGDSLQQPGWINGFVKPLNFMAIDPQTSKMTLIDGKEAEKIKVQADRQILWLVNMGAVTALSQEREAALLSNPQFSMNEVIAKLLNGDLRFDARQWSCLVGWLTERQLHSLLWEFVEEILVPLHVNLEHSKELLRLRQFLKG